MNESNQLELKLTNDEPTELHTAAMSTAEHSLDERRAYLAGLKRQLGETAYAVRVDEAKKRERAVVELRELNAADISGSAARVAQNHGVTPSTIRRWVKRYRMWGIEGLVNVSGGVDVVRDETSRRFRKPNRKTRPRRAFLRWVGGKGDLAADIASIITEPQGTGRYFEPMVGSGAVAFELAAKHTVISDANPHLIDAWIAVRDSVDELLDELFRLPISKQHYLEMRARRPHEIQTSFERAVRFIYLNQCGFNGMYRVNSKGEFNVPYGGDRAQTLDREFFRRMQSWLSDVDIRCGDYNESTRDAGEGDVVYVDPPYLDLSPARHYGVRYTTPLFELDEHARLAEHLHRLAARGVRVFVSHTESDEIRELYPGAKLHRFEAWRRVRGGTRGKRREWLIEMEPR